MRHCTETTSIQIPPHILHRNTHFIDTVHQLIIIRFTFGTADDFTDFREQYIHGTNRFTVFILLHIESFDLFRIVCQDYRTFEMVLNQESFMFRSQIDTPIYREFKCMSFCNRFFQNLDSFRIRQANEIFFQHSLQTFDQTFIEHIVQEFDIIHTVVQSPLYTVLNELFRQLHIIQNIIECHFRLDHPKLGQMTRRIGIFCTKSRTERINLP